MFRTGNCADVAPSKATFSAAAYAAFRPTYPSHLYETILEYHHGPRRLAIDLGCGHGVMAQHFAKVFTEVVGIDPSKRMIDQARSATSAEEFPNLNFADAPAEDLPFIADKTVDLVVAGQAAHWFDTDRFWPEMARVVKAGGTVALFGYKDHVFVDHPNASKILDKYAYEMSDRYLGLFWQQPGRSRVQDKLRALKPPTAGWERIERIEYEPGTGGPKTGEGTMFLNKKMSLDNCMRYVRTWSAVNAWQEAHPNRTSRESGGNGDVVDELFDAIRESENDWQNDPQWNLKEVDIEWGSGLVLARRRKD